MRKRLLKFLLNILLPELTPKQAFFVDKERDILIIQLEADITQKQLAETGDVFRALGFKQVLTVNTDISFKVVHNEDKR
jgi:hypothetical protein